MGQGKGVVASFWLELDNQGVGAWWNRGRPRVQRSRAHQQSPNYRPFWKHLRSR
jgi:hypothetical protein